MMGFTKMCSSALKQGSVIGPFGMRARKRFDNDGLKPKTLGTSSYRNYAAFDLELGMELGNDIGNQCT